MSKDWQYYQNKKNAGESMLDIINEARNEHNLSLNYSFNLQHTGDDIPFNLEREYIIKLVENKKYKEAKEQIESMRRVYKSPIHWNFIEIFEYHLRAAVDAEKNIKLAIDEAKKEFNKHTVTLVAIIVGVITLLGTANQTFTVGSFQEGIYTFGSITIAILAVIFITFFMNRK